MGADSVAYHQATVMGRADDFPGQALAYYASRGETPLVWGGGGAARLGLNGRVTEEQYAAIYGPGGARHPATGAQLAATRAPAMRPTAVAAWSCSRHTVVSAAFQPPQSSSISTTLARSTWSWGQGSPGPGGGMTAGVGVDQPTRGR